MRAQKRAKQFCSAVVVTIAATACGGASGTNECCHNPPPIFSFTPLQPGDSVVRDEDGSCSETAVATGTAQDVTCPPGLTEPGVLRRQADTCTFMPHVECPPPSVATCNPPPPQNVPCP